MTRAQATCVAIVLGAVAILLISALATPGDDVVGLFGHPMPTVCVYRRFLGIDCPGCGLTRSFAYMAHLHVADAFRMHKLGPILFAGVVGLVPYNLVHLWRSTSSAASPSSPSPRARRPTAG